MISAERIAELQRLEETYRFGSADAARAARNKIMEALPELLAAADRARALEAALVQADIIAEEAMSTAPDTETLGLITATRLSWQHLLPEDEQ